MILEEVIKQAVDVRQELKRQKQDIVEAQKAAQSVVDYLVSLREKEKEFEAVIAKVLAAREKESELKLQKGEADVKSIGGVT